MLGKNQAKLDAVKSRVETGIKKLFSTEPKKVKQLNRTILHPAHNDDVEHVIIHKVRPIVHRVTRMQTIRPVIQPVYVSEERKIVLSPVTSNRLRPVRHVSKKVEMSDEMKQKLENVQLEMADVTGRTVTEIHLEDVQESEVEDHYVDEVVEQVQPVIYRKIREPEIVEEIQPVRETVVQTVGVDQVHHVKGVDESEWNRKTGEADE